MLVLGASPHEDESEDTPNELTRFLNVWVALTSLQSEVMLMCILPQALWPQVVAWQRAGPSHRP